MSNDKNTHAFPLNKDKHEVYTERQQGLTKREYFAIMAMQGLLSNCTEDGEFSGLNCASVAVEEADELLKELEK